MMSAMRTASAIMENLDQLDGVNIAEDSLRRDTDSQYFASIIGYTGKISQEEYDALDKDVKKNYSLTDIAGKAGLEQTLEQRLQGVKGETKVYVDSVGKVIETVSTKDPKAGNDVYLTIDKDLQETTYHLIDREACSDPFIKDSKCRTNYDPTTASNASQLIIPIDDVYYAFIGNEIINMSHFSAEDAQPVEQQVYAAFTQRKEKVVIQAKFFRYLRKDPNSAAYKDLSKEMQAYMNYISTDLLTTNEGNPKQDVIDTSSDET